MLYFLTKTCKLGIWEEILWYLMSMNSHTGMQLKIMITKEYNMIKNKLSTVKLNKEKAAK